MYLSRPSNLSPFAWRVPQNCRTGHRRATSSQAVDPDKARRAARRLPIRDSQRKSKARTRFGEKLQDSLQTTKLVLGKKLGEGSFGEVCKTSLAKKPSSKDDEVVLKKTTEYGAVEIWMNERVRRACANSCADFMYGFRERQAKNEVEYWLIWKFEGESTLADLVQSKEFPYNVRIFLN